MNLSSDEKPTVILTKDPDYKKMYPGEFVTFSCHINVSTGWSFEWKKDDVVISESSNTASKTPVKDADDGSYRCRAMRGTNPTFFTDSSQVMDLDVQSKFLFN